jgi:hypothetical protein
VLSIGTLDTPKPVVMQGLGWAIVRCLAVNMMAGGRAGAGPAPLIRPMIKSQVCRQEQENGNKYTEN